MIFYLHYILLTGGLSGTSVLLGVYLKNYSDASQSEIGLLMMSIPFMSIITKPLSCALADRHLAHRSYLVGALLVMLIGFSPLTFIPFFPSFYHGHARFSFYATFVACHIGSAGLNSAWSLGESLALNYAYRTGATYSRMRLMGTASWGVYGYLIGLINETPYLPKFVPAFIILDLSIILEIILILLWDKSDFVMVDPAAELAKVSKQEILELDTNFEDSKSIEKTNMHSLSNNLTNNSKTDLENSGKPVGKRAVLTNKNPQLKLLKMILAEDGRVIKYFVLFTICGLIFSPMNFVFLSYEDVCKKKDCNFSFLAGSVLVSQATSETVAFFAMPWILARISKRTGLCFAMIAWILRYFVYSQFYYTDDFSPYWALILEWGHGIGFSFFAAILADVAYSSSNLCKLFIPELRKLNYLSDTKSVSQEQMEAEEHAIKMALRATMMAIINGLWEGLGFGVGNLLFATLISVYSYSCVWTVFTGIGLTTLIAHQLIECSGSRWSDAFKPKEGTKAYEIMKLEKVTESSRDDENKPEVITNQLKIDASPVR